MKGGNKKSVKEYLKDIVLNNLLFLDLINNNLTRNTHERAKNRTAQWTY